MTDRTSILHNSRYRLAPTAAGLLLRALSLCAVPLCGLLSANVYAAPVGGEITAGSGQIQSPDAKTTVVTQDSSSLSINWDSMNLAADELLQFRQPGREAVALNHILDQNPTTILGQIDANGRVFLMNPNGLIFGESARINVGSLVAGAFQMDSGFRNSPDVLQEYILNIGDAVVQNDGIISAIEQGSVALVGNQVVNNGTIVATLGKVHLLSASEATLSFDSDGLIQFAIDKQTLRNPDGDDSAITNSGKIQADGGYVVLEGQSANGIYANVVNNSGVIHAGRISNQGGVIRLEGSGGVVANSGELKAVGDENSTGGSISLFGDRVGVFDGSEVDASGGQGGGSIHIGGELRGSGEHIAEFTQVASNTSIRADAITHGDGGEIIVYAGDSAWAYGDFSATGGAQSGDGGFVEISGKQGLAMDIDIDLTAANGKNGTLLIDPTDIVIYDGISSDDSGDAFLPEILQAEGAGTLNIDENTLQAIASGTNIKLEASNNITLNDLTDNILALQTGTGNTVTITADSDNTGGGNFTMNTTDTISTDGGALTITGDTLVLGSIDTSGAADGNFTASSKGSTSIVSVDAGTANISLTINSDSSANTDSLTIAGSMTGAGIAFYGNATGGERLIGKDLDSTWTITNANDGTYFSSGFSTTATFTDFPNLVGGNKDDTFTFGASGSLTGKIDGGAHTTEDSVDYSASSSGTGLVTLGTSVTNVEKLTGGAFYDELKSTNANNAWSITGGDDGTVDDSVDTVTFFNFANLTGGTGVDTFTLSGGSISGTIAGGTGNDKLIGNTGANTWNITGANDAGNVTSVNAFTGIENLTGNSGVDAFIFADGISLSGAIDGAGGSDSVSKVAETTGPVNVILGGTGLNGYTNIEAFSSNAAVTSNITGEDIITSWTISGDGDGTVVGTVTSTFTDFDNITGGTANDTFTFSTGGKISGTLDGGAGDDTLIAANEVNTWTITGANTGTVSGGVTGLYSATFQGIENLTGNANNDTFTFNAAAAAAISGNVNGASQAASDVVDLTAKTANQVVDLSKYTGIESFLANGAFSNELQGLVSSPTTWNITGTDSGNIGGTISFSNFDTLTGNSGIDRFILGTSGQITGSIAGGSGTDVLQSSTSGATWHINGTNNGYVKDAADTGNLVTAFSGIDTLQGDSVSGVDVFKFHDPATSFTGLIDGAGGTTDSVDYSAVSSVIAVDLSSSAYANIESFTGGGGASSTLTSKNTANTWTVTGTNTGTVKSAGDSYTIAYNGFTNLVGNAFQDTFTFSGTGRITGSIDGAGGTDDTLTGNNLASSWVVTAADTGTLTDANGANTYSGIEILTGGSAKDSFDFQYIGTYPVTDGGGATDDQATFSSAGTVVANVGPTGLSNIEYLIGNNTDSTVKITASGNNTWSIDAGTNNGSVTSGSIGTVNFDNFTALTGSTADDSFQFQNGASITGLIDGDAGTNEVTFAAVNVGSVDLVLDSTNSYKNIGTFTGSTNVTSTITGENTANNWNITGADSGDIDSVNFVNFQNLTGGTLDDGFVLNGGTVSGNIDGGTGSDTLTANTAANNTWAILATSAGVVTNGTVNGITGNFSGIENITGNTGNDTFNFSDGTSISGVVNGAAGGGYDKVNHAAQTGVVNITLGSSGYTGIEEFVGNGSSSTLTGDNAGSSWSVTGANSGTVGATVFSGFGNLQGGTGSDSFSVSDAGSLTGATGLDGGAGAGTDILQGGVSDHTFNITGAESGNIDGGTKFAAIETLRGNSGKDSFIFASGGSFSGLIDGDANTTDVVDYSSKSGATVVSIAASSTQNIETFVGNGSNGTLQGTASGDTWVITSTDAGTVNGSISFSNFHYLDGGDGADTFTIQAGKITGSITGGLGSDTLTAANNSNVWNITSADDGDITGATLTTNFIDIENLVGNNSDDTFNIGSNLTGSISGGSGDDIFSLNGLYSVGGGIAGGANNDTINGPNSPITWSLTGINSGIVNGNTFSDVENLVGNADVDTFNITNSATAGITGSMSGGAGNDIFTVDYNGSSTRTITFDGGTGTDSLTLTGSGTGFSNTYVLGPSSNEVEITTTDGSVTQTVDVAGIDSVTDTITADTISFTGTSGNDTLTLSDGAVPATDTRFEVGGLLPIEFRNKTNLSINGGSGTDTLTINDTHSFSGDVTLTVDTLSQGAAGLLGANNLILNQVGTVGTSGSRLKTDVSSLSVNGPTTDVYITEQDALSFSVSNVSSILDIELLTGNISSSSNIITSAASTFTVASGNSISLTGSGNQFTGSLAFTSAGTLNNVTLVNAAPVNLQALSLSGDLSITSSGAITQSGALSVVGNSSFSAGAYGITLNNASNDFNGTVSLTNTGANNILINDQNTLTFANSSIGSGDLTVSAGSIAQSGLISQQASAGTATFTANSGSLVLGNAGNDFTGTVVLNNNSGNNTTITESNQLTLGASTLSGGKLTVNTSNGVNLTGTTVSNNGDIEINANSGDIQLGKLDAGSGKITLNTVTGNVVGDYSPVENPNLIGKDLVITSGAKTGDFDNPIAVKVPANGTGYFDTVVGVPHIIGFDGSIVSGSDKIYDDSFLIIATNKRQNFSYTPAFLNAGDGFYLLPLHTYADGGVQIPDYTRNEDDRFNEALGQFSQDDLPSFTEAGEILPQDSRASTTSKSTLE